MNRLSIVIPLFNAEPILENSIERLRESLGQLSETSEILLRDDKSSDHSLLLAQKISRRYNNVKISANEKNEGLGGTLKSLFADASGDVVVYLDIDLPFGADIISVLAEEIENADMVIASRYKNMSNEVNLFRKIASRGYFWLCHFLFGVKVNDIGSGSVAFRKDMLDGIEIVSKGFGVHIELLHFAFQKGFRIKEIGAKDYFSEVGSFSILKHGACVLLETILLWRKREKISLQSS